VCTNLLRSFEPLLSYPIVCYKTHYGFGF
jgi:hypothetical protein